MNLCLFLIVIAKLYCKLLTHCKALIYTGKKIGRSDAFYWNPIALRNDSFIFKHLLLEYGFVGNCIKHHYKALTMQQILALIFECIWVYKDHKLSPGKVKTQELGVKVSSCNQWNAVLSYPKCASTFLSKKNLPTTCYCKTRGTA